jgi:ubiquinone biosynthesis monooxygenase Coq7
MLAARFGDGVNLGFLAETERQVEVTKSHLDRLPEQDLVAGNRDPDEGR